MRMESTLKTLQHMAAKKHAAPAVKHDVIVLLKQDHAMVKKLFHQYEKLAKQGDQRGKLLIANQICAELMVHMKAEEEIFYPPARQATHDDDMINEADVEHDSAKGLIAQLQGMDPADEMYDAKMIVLGEYINHHISEEEAEMFPEVRKSKQLNLKKMGALLSARKEALMDQLCDKHGKIDPRQLRAMAGLGAQH